MFARIFAAIVGLAVFLGALAGIKALQIRALIQAGNQRTAQSEAVTSAIAEGQTWENLLTSIGTIRASRGVQLASEAAGAVAFIGFESGATATEGQILLRLDTTVEEAQLDAAKARLELARLSAARQRDLVATGSSTQADLDSANATLSAAEADVRRIEAEIERRTLRAPFAGRLGIRQINLGQYLQPGTPVVSLQQLDTVLADFSLPQQRLAEVRPGLKVRLTSDAHTGSVFEGVLTAVQPDVDATSRNLRIEASFANPDARLLPGMFANITIVLPESSDVIAIPASAVLYAPYGDSVFVIENLTDENSGETYLGVRKQIVRLGRSKGDLVQVTQGLKGGEQIVSTGAFKLRNGAHVAINNEVKPDVRANPTPPNT